MPAPGDTCRRLAGDPAGRPLVVLVHGVGLSQDMWRDWLPVLAPRFCVLTYDLYGHGGSANPPGARSVRDFVRQLGGLADEAGVERFSLIGFSLGALVSQGFASLHGDRLERLVLLHSVYRRTEEQCQGVRERYRTTRDQGPLVTLEKNLERWFSAAYRAAHPEVMDELREGFARHTGDGYLKAYHLFSHAEDEMRNYPLDRVSCPALVLTGGEDTGSTPAMSEAIVRDLPDARLIVNPGHRHMAPVEHADRLSEQVLSFLTG